MHTVRIGAVDDILRVLTDILLGRFHRLGLLVPTPNPHPSGNPGSSHGPRCFVSRNPRPALVQQGWWPLPPRIVTSNRNVCQALSTGRGMKGAAVSGYKQGPRASRHSGCFYLWALWAAGLTVFVRMCRGAILEYWNVTLPGTGLARTCMTTCIFTLGLVATPIALTIVNPAWHKAGDRKYVTLWGRRYYPHFKAQNP